MPKLLIVGELYSKEDADAHAAFSDGNGRFLKAIMKQCGIDPRRTDYTCVFPIQAPRGSVLSLCGPKSEGIPLMKYFKRGKYVRAEYKVHLDNLWDYINTTKPNLVLAMGDMAMWALTSQTSLAYARGYITEGHGGIPNTKVLPTFSPKQINQTYGQKPYWMADLTKAARELEFPEIRYPKHLLRIEPSLNDMEDFFQDHLVPADAISVDIENKPNMITCVGFAPNPEHALVVPFYDSRKPSGNYWPDRASERIAWQWVARVLRMGKCVYGQNYIYDMQQLWRLMGIANPDAGDDTMLMHHALQPELRKSLGMLASIYTDEVAWKAMRTDTIKKED